jgi:hypothetical protein
MWLGLFLLAGGLLLQPGCTEPNSKPAGGTNVAPGMNSKPGAPAPADTATPPKPVDTAKTPDSKTPDETPTPSDEEPKSAPGNLGSTTGGGIELPGDGQ